MTLITAKEALAMTVKANEIRKTYRFTHAECCIKNIIEPKIIAEAENCESTIVINLDEFRGYETVITLVAEILVGLDYVVSLNEYAMVIGW